MQVVYEITKGKEYDGGSDAGVMTILGIIKSDPNNEDIIGKMNVISSVQDHPGKWWRKIRYYLEEIDESFNLKSFIKENVIFQDEHKLEEACKFDKLNEESTDYVSKLNSELTDFCK